MSIIGLPANDTPDGGGKQIMPDTCAIRSQEFVIERFTGVDMPQEFYIQEAYDHHLYVPGEGTSMANVGKLLELHNIPVTRYDHATQFDLTKELAQGHKVIVGVKAGDLWHHNSFLYRALDTLGLNGPDVADHALVVTGIDTSDPDHVQVIISDPGTGEVAARYPMEQFIEAWDPSGYFMVATKDAPPAHLNHPEMANFPYDQGHIPAVANVPYDQFVNFEPHPDAWENVIHQNTTTDPFDDFKHMTSWEEYFDHIAHGDFNIWPPGVEPIQEGEPAAQHHLHYPAIDAGPSDISVDSI